MELSVRDLAVVQLVARFSQLAGTHVGEVLFADCSRTPLDRTLSRLVHRDYLRRIGRRATGDLGGAGSYVYELGRVGHGELGRPQDYRRTYRVSNHALKVADVYAQLLAAHRQGRVELLETWQVERPFQDARADLYVELGIGEHQVDYCLEIDLGTERAGVIRKKLEAYWRAYSSWKGESFPYVAFLVPDRYRKFEIERVIRGINEGQELFRVHTFNDAVSKLTEL